MLKPLRRSNRDKLLTEGLRVVQELGFSGASVRDITTAANVSLGSFTSHFVGGDRRVQTVLQRFLDIPEHFDQTAANGRAVFR